MLLVKDCPVSTVASHMGCNEKTIVKIMKYWVNKARDNETFEDIRNLAIDETSFRKGHDHVSLIIDADQRSVKDVEKGRDGGVIDRFALYLAEKSGYPDKIEGVTSDLSRSFLPAIERYFPKAEHTIDKFHIKKMLNDAQTLINHKKRIINYFRNRLTNAICEGINSMIQTAKRKARGYRTFDGYATMSYIVAGKLDIDDPFALPV